MTTERLSWPRWPTLAGLSLSILLLAVYAHVPQAWALGLVALAPWLWTLNAMRTASGALVGGVLMAVGFEAVVFGWFGAAIGAYTGVGALPASVVLVLLAPLLQPQWVVFALVRHLVGRRHGPWLRALAAASAWVACEWAVPKLLGDTLGHGLYPSRTLRQVADLGGAAGLTFLLLLVNEAVLDAFACRSGGVRAFLRPVAAGIVIVAGMAIYGTLRLGALQVVRSDDTPVLRVAMVQASITDYERLRREMGAYAVVRHVLDTHYALSMSAIRDHGADVLLWSETVYPTTFGSPRSADGAELDRELQGFVDAAGVPLVFGTYDRDAGGEYNAATFLEPGRGRLGTYRKTHPFPLTEYVPAWLDGPWLRRVLPWAGTWRAGDGARVLPLRSADGREVNVVPLICLDDVRTGLAIDGARLGAQAIVGMSNDSWFSRYPIGARLHRSVAAFRSIETRLPQVRVTTNGYSSIIDDTGEVLASTEIGQQAVLTAFIGAQSPAPTLMVRWGDWVGRAGAMFLLGLAVLAGWRSRRAVAAGSQRASSTFEASVLSPAWRVMAGALHACAGAGLLWLAVDMALRVGWQVQSLAQLWRFAATVVAPMIAAWAIVRAFRTEVRVEGNVLVLDGRRERIEIPLSSIVTLRAWRVPWPGSGVDLELASGARCKWGLRLARPQDLLGALRAAGAPVRLEERPDRLLVEFAQARGGTVRPRLDHALVKFALFPLMPALIAFRLHQIIAFGGTFGEYHTYGAAAWLGGLLIWWTSWSIGLMLFAAALRIVVEIGCALALALWRGRAAAVRDALEWLARWAYYVGAPAWLVLRLLAS